MIFFLRKKMAFKAVNTWASIDHPDFALSLNQWFSTFFSWRHTKNSGQFYEHNANAYRFDCISQFWLKLREVIGKNWRHTWNELAEHQLRNTALHLSNFKS